MERVRREFMELVQIDAVSFSERSMADAVKQKLLELGFEISEDAAGEQYGGNAGNIYGYLKGSLSGEPILFSAHLDTVRPGTGKRAVLAEDGSGRITSGGDTVLGADDVAGIVEILEGIRRAKESGRPFRDVEVLFPIAEEVYIKGTEVFDFSKIRSREAYVLDLSGPVGAAALQAPSLLSFQVTITGRAAHAGFAPEEGIHAIQIMSRAISKIRQGHIDEETTLNIGTVSGGKASNIVPELCICGGEIRSYNHKKALDTAASVRNTFEAEAKAAGAVCEVSVTTDLTAYKTEESSRTVQHFIQACQNLGITPELTRTFGGSDNNNFAKNGIEGIVLSCGMYEVHSVREYTTLQDLELGARLVEKIIT